MRPGKGVLMVFLGMAASLMTWGGVSSLQAGDTVRPCGLFLLLKAGEEPSPQLLEKPFVDGLSIRVRWRDVEPQKGRFDWTYLDRMFTLAESRHKKVMLRLLAGYWSPSWIYEMGVPAIKGRFHGKAIRFPAVWNEKYRRLFAAFVEAVGRRYGRKSQLVLVHLSGPTVFAAEPVLARNQQEISALEEKGFTPDLVIAQWKETVGLFRGAFPGKMLALNLHYIVKGDRRLLVDLYNGVQEDASGILAVQGNWLASDFIEEHRDLFELVAEYGAKGGVVGFQTVAPLLKRAKKKGFGQRELKRYIIESFRGAMRAHAVYLEVYPVDVKYLGRYLDRLDKRMKENGCGSSR